MKNFYKNSNKWEKGMEKIFKPGDLKLCWYKAGDPTLFEIVTEKTKSISHLVFGRLCEGEDVLE